MDYHNTIRELENAGHIGHDDGECFMLLNEDVLIESDSIKPLRTAVLMNLSSGDARGQIYIVHYRGPKPGDAKLVDFYDADSKQLKDLYGNVIMPIDIADVLSKHPFS